VSDVDSSRITSVTLCPGSARRVAASAYDRPVPLSATSGHAGADRCPGVVAVHPAADGGLVRIRVPGGRLARGAFGAVASAAVQLGNGRLELTGRANLQLRGLRPGAADELAGLLSEHGLLPSAAHDRARNVLASPLSGLDGRGACDVRPLVGELDRSLCAEAELAGLPGRFLFALDDGRRDVAALGADVSLVGLPGERLGLLVGGADSGLRYAPRAAVAALLAVARAFLRRRPNERTWRVRELPGGPLSLLDGPVPAQGAIAVPGPAGGAIRLPEASVVGPVGPVVQLDGRVALGLGVPLGALTPARCAALLAEAREEVVLTPWRGVLLPGLTAGAAVAAGARLAEAGLLLDPADPGLRVSACTGRPGCAHALADVRTDARPVSGAVAVHWSGCERRCGRPAGPVLDVVALSGGGYQVATQ
jgi:precorrin-3B synthase